MKKQGELVFGVDITETYIRSVLFDLDSEIFIRKNTEPHSSLMPGAVTVALSQLVESMDPDSKSNTVGISLSLPVDIIGRIVKGSHELPQWVDVPFVDWLELRLNKNILLVNAKGSLHLNSGYKCFKRLISHTELSQELAVACLALEHFRI
ncbi:ROK family protein [Prochlorococcus marinus]|uniref:Carbohydrate kinase FGGY N-terminal domain-containing protein n=1 Tax=Prochlorococcus marinus (strain MIT 9211) TaxID=93059 RepID=A9BAY0_PROM4|nr:ROK family protein [Prochlorococcus marinus]ABX08992.1 Hypothetical protein P9211_10611 [Prochlorococcus marinus str. MIT 9211]